MLVLPEPSHSNSSGRLRPLLGAFRAGGRVGGGATTFVLLREAESIMTALIVIAAALFGGLLWAGRRERRTVYNHEQYIDGDGDVHCDGCGDACGSDDYQYRDN
jgi:hypothetical protein